MTFHFSRWFCRSAAALFLASGVVLAQTADRPNIVMIMADDIGPANVGIYTHGMMVPTPNIDRLAKEGMLFTDHYAEPSCTSGRAAFITGQMPIRTGLTTVGLPGSPIGLDKRDPTLAELLDTLPAPANPPPMTAELPPLVLTRIDCAQGELNFLSTFTTFGMPQDITLSSLRIEHLIPADGQTWGVMTEAYERSLVGEDD